MSRKSKLAKARISLDNFLEQSSAPPAYVPETIFPDPLIEISIASQNSGNSSSSSPLLSQQPVLPIVKENKEFVESKSNPIDFALFNISQEFTDSPVKMLTRPENRHIDPSKGFQWSVSQGVKSSSQILNKILDEPVVNDSFILRSEDEDSLTDEKIRIWHRKIKQETPSDEADV